MDWLTRLVLKVLGWHSYVGRDARGERYEAWLRRSSYFHVYHERTANRVLRPESVAGIVRRKR